MDLRKKKAGKNPKKTVPYKIRLLKKLFYH